MPDLLDIDEAVARQLVLIRQTYRAPDTDLVCSAVHDAVQAVCRELADGRALLLREVEELGRTIAVAKAEIAELRADDITGSDIPSATDELDAIVAHTAAATDTILESCETLDSVAAALTDHGSDQAARTQLQTATTRIYEACSFQDITGQRITKVVATLKSIEMKVGGTLKAFAPSQIVAMPSRPPDLLNGPQLPAHAMGQSAVDALLASFE